MTGLAFFVMAAGAGMFAIGYKEIGDRDTATIKAVRASQRMIGICLIAMGFLFLIWTY